MEGSVIAAIVIALILVLVAIGFVIWYQMKPAIGSSNRVVSTAFHTINTCNAANCNATMKALIAHGSPMFNSATLPSCNNCPQYLYGVRTNGLNISKDGVNWTQCGSPSDCYNTMKFAEQFRDGRY